MFIIVEQERKSPDQRAYMSCERRDNE